MKPTVPCYGCQERVSGCHGGCRKYADYKVAFDAEKSRVMAIKQPDKEWDDMQCKTSQRLRKRNITGR